MRAPASKIYARVADLTAWKDWNPWLMHEPDTPLKYGGTPGEPGSSMSWDGQYIGAGTLTHSTLKKNRSIESRFDFVRPFRNTSKDNWEFITRGRNTEVVWTMSGKIPFVLRFMIKLMRSMIASDYQIGLLRLNRLVDREAALFQLDFRGETELKSCRGLYDTYRGPLQDLPELMEKDFTILFNYLKNKDIRLAGMGRTAYWKTDTKNKTTVCDRILPVEQPADASRTREYPGGKNLIVRFYGPYQHLQLAWFAATRHLQLKKMKRDKSRPSFEIYEKHFWNAKSPSDYVTDIYLPLRS